ncbi:unnamed protein product [Arctogadus glacialis]
MSQMFSKYTKLSVIQRCKCNLHANTCVYDKGRLGCECEHNTTGPDCSRCKRHYHGRAWSVGSYLPIPKGTANICIPSGHGASDRANASSLGVANRNQVCQDKVKPVRGSCALQLSAARVCDNAMLRCQNGGTCHHHQRCHCSAGFTGVLCERARCSGGECDGQSSGQDPLLLLQPSHHSGPLGALAALALPLLSMTLC